MLRLLLIIVPLAVAAAIFFTVVRDLLRRFRRKAAVGSLDERVVARQRQAAALPGGAAANPIEIETPAVVEPMAEAEKCLRCGGSLHLSEHVAQPHGSARLRVAKMRCPRCGTTRELFFCLRHSQLN